MSDECLRINLVITKHLNSEEGRVEMKAMMIAGASPEEIIGAFAKHGTESEAALMFEELASLPANFVDTFMTAWLVADRAGRPFTLTSRAAERPLDYARRGLVSYQIEHDEQGVTMYVSHVHGRHAEWYKPAVLVA